VTEKSVAAPDISPEEYEKYRGRDVVLYKNKIIADGANSKEAIEKAKKKYPSLKTEEMVIFYIVPADELIL
jgi:hypothetical protein